MQKVVAAAVVGSSTTSPMPEIWSMAAFSGAIAWSASPACSATVQACVRLANPSFNS